MTEFLKMSAHKHWNLDFSIGSNNHSGNNIGINGYPAAGQIGYNPIPQSGSVGHTVYPQPANIGFITYPSHQHNHHYVYGHGERPPQ